MIMSRITTVQGFLVVQPPSLQQLGRRSSRVSSLLLLSSSTDTGTDISTDNTSLVEELNKLTQEFLDIQGKV